jgi:pimeloyl-ACP methyl ester carboxylesterase
MRAGWVGLLTALVVTLAALPSGAQPGSACGEPRVLESRGATTRYAISPLPAQEAPPSVLMLIGGSGKINLDDKGCPRFQTGSSLMRMRMTLRTAGFVVVLVDVPSDHAGEDGLGGFRNQPAHAEDLGKIIQDVRARTRGAVWVMGHSRGTISAASAAARLSGPAAPDGTILLSSMLVGDSRARKVWAAQTVFDVPLEAIRKPLLVLGHAADNCPRSPASLGASVAKRAAGAPVQVVTMTGGTVAAGRPPALSACEVGEPHDFIGQEAELVAGLMRFMSGGSY